MSKILKIIALSAASFALSTAALAEGTSKSATTTTDMNSATSMTGDQDSVRRIQEQLRSKGYPVGRVDGNMGPRTSQALRDFQTSQGLSSTGQIDQQTMSALGGSGTMGTSGTGSTTGSTSDDAPMGSEAERQGRSPSDTTTQDTAPQGEGTGGQ